MHRWLTYILYYTLGPPKSLHVSVVFGYRWFTRWNHRPEQPPFRIQRTHQKYQFARIGVRDLEFIIYVSHLCIYTINGLHMREVCVRWICWTQNAIFGHQMLLIGHQMLFFGHQMVIDPTNNVRCRELQTNRATCSGWPQLSPLRGRGLKPRAVALI